jgi:amino acid adenylation domain-containing protein
MTPVRWTDVTQLHELAAPTGPMAAEEWYGVQRDWHETHETMAEFPVDRSVHELFGEQVRRNPDATALVFQGERISYAQLNERANRLAHHLVHLGIGRRALVGVYLERGPAPVAAVLAVLKAGAGYTMLDPDSPPARIDTVLAEAGVAVVVTRLGLSEQLRAGGVTHVLVDADAAEIAARPSVDVTGRGRPADVACVLFGSRQTGRPKGIVCSHQAVVGTLCGQSYVDFGPGEVVLQCAPVCWDGFALELFGALLSGATCVLQPGQRPQPRQVAALAAQQRVSILHLPASLVTALATDHPEVFDTVRQVLTRGEPASMARLTGLLERYPGLRLVHGYSPAESMILTAGHVVDGGDTQGAPVPVGRPVPNKRIYVLDDRLQPVPTGSVGELYTGGIGLAYGYLNHVGLTALRFVANPFAAGERMYRTGHLARWRSDGELDFLDPTDH